MKLLSVNVSQPKEITERVAKAASQLQEAAARVLTYLK